MKLIHLSEFKRLADVPDSALVALLASDQLPISIDANNRLMIDVDSVATQSIVAAIANERSKTVSEQELLIAERVARIVGEEFEAVIDQALSNLGSIRDNSVCSAPNDVGTANQKKK